MVSGPVGRSPLRATRVRAVGVLSSGSGVWARGPDGFGGREGRMDPVPVQVSTRCLFQRFAAQTGCGSIQGCVCRDSSLHRNEREPAMFFSLRTVLGCGPAASGFDACRFAGRRVSPAFTSSDQANRRIRTGQLSALLRVHLRPIDVVVYHGPQARPCFVGGFPLRCLQRLSCPDIATLHCGWRHNRSTSGPSTPVLSY